VLDAEPGDYILMARKAKGADQWFMGAITDENSRGLAADLSFLDEGKVYQAIIYRDADNADWKNNPEAYTIEKKLVNKNSVLGLKLAPGGGAAISMIPLTAEQQLQMKKEIKALPKSKKKK